MYLVRVVGEALVGQVGRRNGGYVGELHKFVVVVSSVDSNRRVGEEGANSVWSRSGIYGLC